MIILESIGEWFLYRRQKWYPNSTVLDQKKKQGHIKWTFKLSLEQLSPEHISSGHSIFVICFVYVVKRLEHVIKMDMALYKSYALLWIIAQLLMLFFASRFCILLFIDLQALTIDIIEWIQHMNLTCRRWQPKVKRSNWFGHLAVNSWRRWFLKAWVSLWRLIWCSPTRAKPVWYVRACGQYHSNICRLVDQGNDGNAL